MSKVESRDPEPQATDLYLKDFETEAGDGIFPNLVIADGKSGNLDAGN